MKIYYETPNALMHYGVPGMKWGRRKAKVPVSSMSPREQRKLLEKEYGELEDQMTYGKKANLKKNSELQKKMSDIEKKMDDLSKSGNKLYGKYLEQQQRNRNKQFKRDRFNTVINPDNPVSKIYKLKDINKKYKHDSVEQAHKIAKNKAKIDPKYKNDPEYKKAMKDYGRQKVLDILKDAATPKKPENPYKYKRPKYSKDF